MRHLLRGHLTVLHGHNRHRRKTGLHQLRLRVSARQANHIRNSHLRVSLRLRQDNAHLSTRINFASRGRLRQHDTNSAVTLLLTKRHGHANLLSVRLHVLACLTLPIRQIHATRSNIQRHTITVRHFQTGSNRRASHSSNGDSPSLNLANLTNRHANRVQRLRRLLNGHT